MREAMPVEAEQPLQAGAESSRGKSAIRSAPERFFETWLDALGDADPRLVDLSGEAITVAANAGDLVIWRYDLPHGASANRATRPRMAQYANMYSPAWVENPLWR